MRIALEMEGTSALVLHNPRLADPNDPLTKAIAQTTDKGSGMTDSDRLEVAHLEFIGGLYLGKGGPVLPCRNILRTLANAAKIRRMGKDVERALISTELEVPIEYKGPRDPEGLWADHRYRYSTPVRIGRALVIRMRPSFPEWRVVSHWELMEEILNYRDFAAIAEVAGLIEGVGDNRRNGHGRFVAHIAEVLTSGQAVRSKAA